MPTSARPTAATAPSRPRRSARRDFPTSPSGTRTPSPVCCTRGGRRLRIRAVRRGAASTSWGRRASSSARSDPTGRTWRLSPSPGGITRFSEPTSRMPHRSTPLSACSRCGRRRTSTASSSPASARRTSRSLRCRAVLRIAFSSWSCATRHARRRISGRAAERTPCVVCSCRRCTASSSPPPRRIARPLNRRCASALQRWITATL